MHTQREIKNLRGHSVRLDINAKTTADELLDIEIQRADKGAGTKRRVGLVQALLNELSALLPMP